MSRQLVRKVEREPDHYKLADWMLKQKDKSIPKQRIGTAILNITDENSIKNSEFGSWITRARFRLEQKYGCTLVYLPMEHAYRVVEKGSYEASRFTMAHYRRAVLSAARAQELNDLGFLDPKHIDSLVESVLSKASRRTKELSSLKTMLLSKWKQLRTQERKALTDENS